MADDDVVYQYSRARWVQGETQQSILYRLRGALLTLHAQMQEVLTLDAPVSATLECGSEIVHVIYRRINPHHVLIAATRCVRMRWPAAKLAMCASADNYRG